MERVESEIGWGDKTRGVMDFTNGVCYPITSVYENLGLELYYMLFKDNFLTSINVSNSETVKLKTGIEINVSSKHDVLVIYGKGFEGIRNQYEIFLKYFELGISFCFKKDTVSNYKIYKPFVVKEVEKEIEVLEYRKYVGPPFVNVEK